MLANLNFSKLMGKASFTIQYVFILFAALSLSACGGGGGGGGGFGLNGAPVSGSFSPTATSLPVYSFTVVAGTPYTVNLVSTSGDADLLVYDDDINKNSGASQIGISWTSGLDQVSFVASFDGKVYIHAFTFDATSVSYTVQATSNNFTVDAAPITAFAEFKSLIYSFDAEAGFTYEVVLTPGVDNVNIGAVSPRPDLGSSIGSSTNAGTAVDSIYVPVLTTQRYYIRVTDTNVATDFNVSVRQVPNEPDLRAVIDSVTSDGTNAIVDYTVYNDGTNPYTGDFQLDVWSDAATAPLVGSTGEDFTTHSGTLVGLGGSVSGRLTVANAAETGTAYVVVDTIEAILESNENNNVSTAVSWEKPILVPLVGFDFEAGAIPAKTVMSGDASWAIDNSAAGAGSIAGSLVSLVSGVITDGQSSCFAFDAYNSQSTRISYDRKVSSETADKYRFYIDGVQRSSVGGTVAWGNIAVTTTSGQHEYKWCYTKDSVATLGTDQAWIDNIEIVSVPSDLRVTITSVSSNGSEVTINYRINNDSSVPVGAFTVDFWSDAPVAPTVGATGETTVSHNAGLNGYGSVTGAVTIANGTISGTAYAVVDSTDAILETDEIDNVSAGVVWGIPELNVTVTGAVADGANVTVSYVVTNSGAGTATGVTVDLWEDAATVPVIGDTGSSTIVVASLAAGDSVSGSVSIANIVTIGTAYAIVDTGNTFVEIDEINNVSAGFALITAPTAPAAYDLEAGLLPPAMIMSGNTGWVIDGTNGAAASTTSLRSGTITHNQTSCAAITVLASSNVSFDYGVSSESCCDRLRFNIDGVEQINWSGTVAWTNASYPVTTGTHEYQWCYTKDGSVNTGSDAAWIDNITIN